MLLSPQSQALIDNFSRQRRVRPDHVNNLQSILNNSPALVEQLNAAVAEGHLQEIAPLSPVINASGRYDGENKVISLSLGNLTTRSRAGDVTFILGHELQHGLDYEAVIRASSMAKFKRIRMARSESTTHDYTAIIGEEIATYRHIEASAEIAGWNAVVSAVKSANPNPTLENLYQAAPGRMSTFIDRYGSAPNFTYASKPSLSLNPDLTLTPTPANIEAAGKYYFDAAAIDTNLGYHGNSDYTNYYGAVAVSNAANRERFYNPPQGGVDQTRMALDMASLGLSEKLLEENGIHLGDNTHPMPYHDISTTPPSLHHFDHTATTHTHIPNIAQAFEVDSPSASGAYAQTDDIAPARESPVFPHTATDDYLEAYCAAAERGDSAACTALYEHHAQLPHMQKMAQQGRELYEGEQQRQREEQRSLEEPRRQEEQDRTQGLEQKQHQERSR